MRTYQKLRQGSWYEKGDLRHDRARLKEHHRREIAEDNPTQAEADRDAKEDREFILAMDCYDHGPCRRCRGEDTWL